MFDLLTDFFLNIFYTDNNLGFMSSGSVSVFDFTCELGEYLAFLCALISLTFIVVLCCLFVYKIIKLVGGLITR